MIKREINVEVRSGGQKRQGEPCFLCMVASLYPSAASKHSDERQRDFDLGWRTVSVSGLDLRVA